MLTTSKGARVFVIGTAHFSKESQEDVASVMRKVRPDVVVLELCKSRTNILQMDEETILSESASLGYQKVDFEKFTKMHFLRILGYHFISFLKHFVLLSFL